MADRHRPTPPRATVAVLGTARIVARRPIPPILRGILQHFMVAGPLVGLLSALYGSHLSQTASLKPDAVLHATIRQAAASHGHFLHFYYITPAQNALWWTLSSVAMVWLIGLVGTVVGLGIKSHYSRGRRR